jgi:hypothetical protein
MDPMSEYLARAVIEARLVSAQGLRQGRRIEDERRAGGRRERRATIAGWWHSRASRAPGVGSRGLAAAAATPVRLPSVELAQVLDEAAYHVAEQGTSSERRLLEAMSEVVAQSLPGAAAALVDREGTEVSRLRAFGLVHTHLLEVLGPREHAWILDLLDGGGGLERPCRVA